MDLISRQAAYGALLAAPLKWDDSSVWESARCHQWMMDVEVIKTLPSAQPEQRVEELLPDGTLHLFTDTDLSKVDRVLVSQNNTHYGALYYTDEDPKMGKWIPCSERLPEIDELVLVTDDSGGVKTVDVDRCGQYECSEKRFWYYTQNVVAWMPLPEPYRAERREE